MLKPIVQILTFLAIISFILTSCTPQKKLTYLQQKGAAEQVTTANKFQYRLQPGDVLMITVQGLDGESSVFFNPTTDQRLVTSSVGNTDGSNMSLYGYSINDSGYVELPVCGMIKVINLTLSEVKSRIQEAVNQYLKEGLVTVKLLSFKVTILGEVNKPGIYRTFEDRLTILDALGMAGDLTSFGNRQKILIIRHTLNETFTFTVDITDRNIIHSPYYYLLPNDMIYVKAHKAKAWGFKEIPIGTIFSVITTAMVIMTFILNTK